jgi:DUF2914 family protein/tetratricopeptide repeat protein
MMESAEARPILAAAEAAAASNDYASAERLLREAAVVQERTLGPAHPDLANTFNNLGVVCERAGRIDDADACYRRAHAIATTAFPPDHPFVATSRQNLEEFCMANGRSVDTDRREREGPVEHATAAPPEPVTAAPPEPVTAAPTEPVAAGPIEQGPAATAAPMRLQFDTPTPVDGGPEKQGPTYSAPTQATHTAERAAVTQRVPERRPSRALPLGALAVMGISFAIVLVGLIAWPSRDSNDAPPPAPESSSAATIDSPRAAEPAAERAPATASTPPAPPPDRATPTVAAEGLTVADVRLCRTLSTSGQWDCEPLGDPAAPGPMVFYTRIVAPQPTTVQHRWYFGERLEQSVTLDIQPNSGGFRTFSRRTSNARRAGPWRVELRSQDGQLLREERFTVSP